MDAVPSRKQREHHLQRERLSIPHRRDLHSHDTSAARCRARVILGTDTDNPYVVPGFSLHDELEYLVQAGFTPFEAIEAGTRNAAEALGALDEFGTISPGKRADLILVQGDPLKDVANARKRVGVMLRGNWLPEPELQKLLGELMDSYTPTIYERVWPLGLIALPVILILRRLVNRIRTSRREKSG